MRFGLPHCIKTGDRPTGIGKTSAKYQPKRGTAFPSPWLSLDH
jgi:hypothetical protein